MIAPRLIFGLALVATTLAIVGSFSPWAWVATIPYDGTKGTAGWTTCGAAVLAISLLAGATWQRAAWLALLAAVPAAAVAVVAGYHAQSPDRYVGSPSLDVAELGWGAPLTVVSGTALAALCLLVAAALTRSR